MRRKVPEVAFYEPCGGFDPLGITSKQVAFKHLLPRDHIKPRFFAASHKLQEKSSYSSFVDRRAPNFELQVDRGEVSYLKNLILDDKAKKICMKPDEYLDIRRKI